MQAIVFSLLGCLVFADPADAIPRLVAQLQTGKPDQRKEAAQELGRLGADGKPALGDLVKAFNDDNREVRLAAVDAVRFIGPSPKTGVPGLIDVLKGDKDAEVRGAAANALGRFGKEPTTVLPALTAALKDESAEVRRYAIYGLKLYRAEAKAALPAILDTLNNDKSEEVRCIAADLLGKLGADPKTVVPALAAAVKAGGEPGTHALKALVEIGPEAKAALPEMTAALQDKTMRAFTAQTLARMKGDGLAVLTKALEDKDDDLRVEVVVALRLAGKDAVPALQTALKYKNVEVRLNAADSLGRLGADARDAVPGLVAALKDESKDVRAEAAAALGRIGPDAKDAEAALTALKDDSEITVRAAAAQALTHIKRKKN
jgi:HEAT repeat protein